MRCADEHTNTFSQNLMKVFHFTIHYLDFRVGFYLYTREIKEIFKVKLYVFTLGE